MDIHALHDAINDLIKPTGHCISVITALREFHVMGSRGANFTAANLRATVSRILTAQGYEVEYTGEYRPNMMGFDIAITFHVTPANAAAPSAPEDDSEEQKALF